MTRLLSLIILVTITVQMAFAKISFSTELLNSANQGNVEAQYDLALCYYYGYGCNVDYESAFKWFDGSAQKGYYPAIYALSICYEKGHGCIRNQELAFSLCKLAAEKGMNMAKNRLGILYEKGIGCAQG